MRSGEVVAGRFQVEALAGVGGMGSVYRARDLESGAPVAVKLLFPERISDVARFSREVALLRELRHPEVVAYVAHGALPNGAPYLVMEWAEGHTLAELLQAGALGVQRSLRVGLGVARALAAAHRRGVIHRDIKPRNLILGRDDAVKVLDFGIARSTEEAGASLTQTGMFLGTPGYIAPEQARGDEHIDPRADLFSLGCVLFECLTGRAAFVANQAFALLAKLVVEEVPAPSALAPEVPAGVDALLGRLLAKDPALRPPNADAVVAALEALLSGSLRPTAADTVVEVAPRRLTESEQRLIAVVLSLGERQLGLASTAVGREAALAETLAGELAPLGVAPARLADGSIICAITGQGLATDLAARAARCALVVKRHLPGRPVVVATGRAVATRGGALPAGEVIDRAAELLRAAAHEARDRIQLDHLTAGLLDPTFDVRGEGRALFLIKEGGPLEIRRRLLGKEAPFLGRERELTFLHSLFEECASEPASTAVAVIGAAGMGKSRLLAELLARVAAERSATVWVAKSDALAAHSPFSLVAQLVRRAAGLTDDEPAEVRRTKLRARVLRTAPEAEADHLTELLGELAGIPTASDPSPRLRAALQDGLLLREELARAWDTFLANECAVRPLVLVLEDLQWGDLPSLKLIERALVARRDAPLFVLAAGRPGVETQFPSLWEAAGVQELRLSKLSRGASRSLVRSVLGEALPEARLDAIVARADGNAFYLEELIRAVADSSDQLPETLVAMVEERLQGLDTGARRVLRAASVFGERFWSGGLRAILGDAGSAALVESWLETLRREELIDALPRSRFGGEDEHAFRHALLREAAYASLVPEDRVAAHRAAGRWLEAAQEGDAALLAEHFERGAEPSRAVSLYRRAAEQALEGHDLETALDRARRGVASGAEGEELGRLRIVEGEVYALRGDNLEAERCGTEVLALVPRGSLPWCWAAGNTVALRVQLGDTEAAVELAGALAEVSAAPTVAPTLIRAAAAAMPYLAFAGAYPTARRLLAQAEAALAGLDAAASPAARGWVELATAQLAGWAEGRPERALAAAEAAVASFTEARSELAAAIARIGAGAAWIELSQPGAALAALEPAIEAAERAGAGFYAALARMFAGRARASAGDLGAARNLLEAVVQDFYHQGNTTYFGVARIFLAEALWRLGDLQGALREADEAALACFAAPGLRVVALAVLGRVRLDGGELALAQHALEEADEALTTLGSVAHGEALLALAVVEALERSGQPEAAQARGAQASAQLMLRAERLAEPTLRQAFLERPEHAALLARRYA